MDIGIGTPHTEITSKTAEEILTPWLDSMAPLRRVLLIPPDFTRSHSWAGELTQLIYRLLPDDCHVEVMPALGTHVPMKQWQIEKMYQGIPLDKFRIHDWRNDLVKLGEVPADFVREVTGGRLDYTINCEVNKLLVEGNWDRIISIGQLVPHEVAGIANHNKNIFVGVGGQDSINKSHFIGAVCGMERVMGREKSPVRDVFNYMGNHFAQDLPITYLLTVRARNEAGNLVTRGLFAGESDACYLKGAKLCQQVNLDLLDEPIRKAVVYLEPGEFHSTWIGDKAIYRLRMAMADDGELIILAPTVQEFGEDKEIDRLIRKYGYRSTPETLAAVEANPELRNNLSAAAHLIHGSTEGRFRVTWCPGKLTREEVEGVGYEYGDLSEMLERYPVDKMKDGMIDINGEKTFYVSNPALGLWALKSQF